MDSYSNTSQNSQSKFDHMNPGIPLFSLYSVPCKTEIVFIFITQFRPYFSVLIYIFFILQLFIHMYSKAYIFCENSLSSCLHFT